MGTSTGAPINELVGILSVLDGQELDSLRRKLPELAIELRPGQIGGLDESGTYDMQRAEVAVRSLLAIANRAATELQTVQGRMRSSRRHRLIAQILTLIGSSGVLGALALKEATAAIVTSILTLLASIGTLLADHGERLLKPGQGDIYEAFDQASNASYRARRLADDLRLAIQHTAPVEEIRTMVVSANQLAETLHGWAVKMAGSR